MICNTIIKSSTSLQLYKVHSIVKSSEFVLLSKELTFKSMLSWQIGQYITSNGGVVAAEELAPYLDVMPTKEKMVCNCSFSVVSVYETKGLIYLLN